MKFGTRLADMRDFHFPPALWQGTCQHSRNVDVSYARQYLGTLLASADELSRKYNPRAKMSCSAHLACSEGVPSSLTSSRTSSFSAFSASPVSPAAPFAASEAAAEGAASASWPGRLCARLSLSSADLAARSPRCPAMHDSSCHHDIHPLSNTLFFPLVKPHTAVLCMAIVDARCSAAFQDITAP